MTSIRLQNIRKQFGAVVALDDVELDISPGELFFLLGPSGCGKSTLLRIVAGLLEPTSGRVLFNQRDVTHVGTEKRNAVMCFQSYALWPHLSVRDNVKFGLEVRGQSRQQQMARVDEVLSMVQMDHLAERKPNELSGGQQQRVALARALAVNPACLLLDEPLSNLDTQLRLDMRTEIRRICKAGGFTTIYVTHDQKEALSIGDRIAVLRDGKLTQVGTPTEIFRQPASVFVAEFIGQTNILRGRVVERNATSIQVETPAGRVVAAAGSSLPDEVMLSIRPEQMKIVQDGIIHQGMNRFIVTPVTATFLGEASEHMVRVKDQTLKVISTPPLFNVPAQLAVEFDPADVVVLSK